MAGHSRPKDGVLSHAYVPAIHVFIPIKTWMPGTRPGMTEKRRAPKLKHPPLIGQAGVHHRLAHSGLRLLARRHHR